MREIKFRAWDKIHKEMCSVNAIFHYDNIIEIEGARPSVGAAVLNDGEFELMQYTGLLDKNGKEIYEGDVIQTSFERNSYGCESDWAGDGVYIGIVHYQPSKGFILKNIIETYDGGDPEKIKHVRPIVSYRSKIIGNIYENPELKEARIKAIKLEGDEDEN